MVDYHLVLVAAGDGTRLGSELRKAAVPVAGSPLVVHALRRATAHRHCRGAVLVVHPDDVQVAADWLLEASLGDLSARVVAGGKTRRQSVVAGVEATGAVPGTLVAIHDGARPVLHREDLDAVLEQAAICGAATLASPVTDTLHRTDSTDRWLERVDREGLWRAQTPQIFEVGLLREALTGAGERSTDEVEAVAGGGTKVQMVASKHPNPKVTTASDLQQVEVFLRSDSGSGSLNC